MHEVLISVSAQDDLHEAHAWWSEHRSAEQANRWYDGFVRAIFGLGSDPTRHALAAESELFAYDVRQLNYGLGNKPTHRALYTMRDDKVVVLRVRHLAQGPLSKDEF